MKHSVVILFFVAVSLFTFAQFAKGTNPQDKPQFSWKNNLYSLSSYSPDICFITIKERPIDSGKMHNWEHYYTNQKVGNGYRYSQMLGWQKNNKWAFETGIELLQKIMCIDFTNFKNIPEVKVKNNHSDPDFFRTRILALNIPLRVVYTQGKNKLKFFSYFGINKTFSFNISQERLNYNSQNKLYVVEENTGHTEIKKVFSASDWGAGIKYTLNNKSHLRMNAAVQRSYASLKSYHKKILFWNTGLALAWCYVW